MADLAAKRYETLTIRGGAVDRTIALRDYAIAQERRFTEEAFWLTLESENLWSNCGAAGPFEYRVYYDRVQLRSR